VNQILALIPAFNEEEEIADVVKEACVHLPVLVVDDGSTDETPARAADAGGTILKQSPNQGKGAALMAGFRWAIDNGYEAVLTLDADGQHNPCEIPGFLDAYNTRHVDLIIGERDLGKIPGIRRLSNWIGKVTYSWALGTSIPDNQSGYRLISKRLMEAMLESEERGFEYEVEMITTCVRLGYTLDWVPISTIYAGETSHIDPWTHVKNWVRIVWKTRRGR
jgi:glycosyltransferase involved in cell wall biosynthesis